MGRKGGRAGNYEDWTKAELLERPRELEVEGRSQMNKDALSRPCGLLRSLREATSVTKRRRTPVNTTPDDHVRLPGLDGLDERQHRSVKEVGRPVPVSAHWSLILEQSPADSAYLLLEGHGPFPRRMGG